jgi:hypothetical protein
MIEGGAAAIGSLVLGIIAKHYGFVENILIWDR